MLKRILCLLLAVIMVCSLAGCGNDEPTKPTVPGSNPTQGTEGTDPEEPTEPEFVMPDAPTEGLSMMEYNAAYNTLQDITSEVTFTYTSFPSTKEITVNSITEFSKQEQADAFFNDFANLGYTGNYYQYRVEDGYRNFFIANTEYSKQFPLQPQKVVHNADTDTVYVMLGYWYNPYVENQPKDYQSKDVADQSVASYSMVGFNAGKYNNAEHIVFVSPEQRELCRQDINVSVVSYDAKYQDFKRFLHSDSSISSYSYSFPSTKVPTANKADFITSKDAFMAIQDEYNDIITREEDWVIFEPGCVLHHHRTIGLENYSKCDALINVLVSSPELDAYSSLRCESFWLPTGEKNADGTDKTALYSYFYDEATQTVYLYLGYNGQPHTQYEAHVDKQSINENSKATYAMVSIDFNESMMDKVQNIVIVLPDPETVPAK